MNLPKGTFWDKGIQLVDGCTKESTGCRDCWAEAMTARFKRVPEVMDNYKFNGKVIFNLDRLKQAVKVKAPKVFAIWNDLYHEGVTDEQILDTYLTMVNAEHHTFLIVTKRPERASFNMSRFMDICFDYGMKRMPETHPVHAMSEKTTLIKDKFFRDEMGVKVTGNIWHIVTMENQEMVDKRMPHLLSIPGKRGIIIEPMLGPIDIDEWLVHVHYKCEGCGKEWAILDDTPDCDCPSIDSTSLSGIVDVETQAIHQVILGPENGHTKRPFNPAWADSVKRQCEVARVPYYRKDINEGEIVWSGK